MTKLDDDERKALRRAMISHIEHALANGDTQLAADLATLMKPEDIEAPASDDEREAWRRLVTLIAVDVITGAGPL